MIDNSLPAWQALYAALLRIALNAVPGAIDDSIRAVLGQTGMQSGADRALLYLRQPDALRKTHSWARRDIIRAAAGDELHDMPTRPEWPRLERGEAVVLSSPVPTLVLPLLDHDRMTGLAMFENVDAGIVGHDVWSGMIGDLLLALLRQAGSQQPPSGSLPDLSDEIRNATLWAMPDIVFEVDVDGRFRSIISPDTPRDSRAPDDMVGSLLEDVLPDDVARSARRFMQEIESTGRIQGRIQEFPTARRSIWYEVSGAHCASRTPGEAPGYLFVMRDITARIEADAELRRLGRIVEMMTNLVKIVDTSHRIVWVNPAFESQTGHTLDQIRGKTLQAVMGGQADDTAHQRAIAGGTGFEGESMQHDRHGKPFWVTFNMQPLHDTKGKLSGFVYVDTPITERRELEMALRSERDFLSILMDTSMAGIFACEADGRCVFANPEGQRLMPLLDPKQTGIVGDWSLVPLEDGPETSPELPFASVMRTGGTVRGARFALQPPGAARRVFSVNASPLGDGAATARVVMALADITAEYEAEENERRAAAKALHDADHDALTGLPNRRQFNRRLDQVIEGGAAKARQVIVMIIDVDKFKGLKTLLGHSAGDDLIRAFSERLKSVLPEVSMLGRIEGYNFVTFLENSTVGTAGQLAKRLRKATAQPFEIDGVTIYLTVSVGISSLVDSKDTAEILIQQAELASYQAKAAGGNSHAHFVPALAARFSRRNRIVQALRRALRDNEFELAFQPKFSLEPNFPLAGAEALLRWNSPDLGRVGPDEFIPVAETAGVMPDMDFHVMRLFAQRIGQLRRNGHALNASLNLSPGSFENPSLAPDLLSLLKAQDIPPSSVTVEITETSLVSSSTNAIANLERFRSAGVVLSVDDFGTGYSSLSYLQRLIVSEIKLDKSFIHPLGGEVPDKGAEAIVRAILSLGSSFGLRTVAEGVETLGQLEWLRREGCNVIQGYLGGRAVSAETFERSFLRQGALVLPATAARQR